MSTGITPAPAAAPASGPAPARAADGGAAASGAAGVSGTSATSGAEIEALLAAPLGLRERKKLKTRRVIRAAAFRLFADQGYESTTVDQIAAAADVSPSTFFRYFPTKEDLIITDDYDPLMVSVLRARPVGEPLLESIRQMVMPALRTVMVAEREELLFRMRMLHSNLAIRNRSAGELLRTRDLIVEILAERAGEQADLLALRATVAAVLAACSEAVEYWAQNDGEGEIADLVEHALDAVATSFRQ